MSLAHKSSIVRQKVESGLAQSVPSALTPRRREIRELLTSEVPQFDLLMNGGIAVGAITEFVGVTGSGRTTMASSFVAASLRDGRVAAWVDVSDSLDPECAALNGIELSRLLWVRCKQSQKEIPKLITPPTLQERVEIQGVRGGGSPHPRAEGRGMPEAISAMLKAHGGLYDKHTRRDKTIGTPGAANRPLSKVLDREEQVSTDRVSRRAAVTSFESRCADPKSHKRNTAARASMTTTVSAPDPHERKREVSPWQSLDHALRAVDLLLQSGGFGVIVLDLGDTPAEFAWRIPLATWFRFRAGCDRSRTSLLLLTKYPCARSSAELVVRLDVGEMQRDGQVLAGFAFRAEIERQRFKTNVVTIRKPPQSERPGCWIGRTSWAI